MDGIVDHRTKTHGQLVRESTEHFFSLIAVPGAYSVGITCTRDADCGTGHIVCQSGSCGCVSGYTSLEDFTCGEYPISMTGKNYLKILFVKMFCKVVNGRPRSTLHNLIKLSLERELSGFQKLRGCIPCDTWHQDCVREESVSSSAVRLWRRT